MRRDLDALAAETFDLLVIGGGITGAGAALDAALRGLRVALIDKGDFASGTSSISSKLVHGGLRYLEQGDFFLVCEALHERRRLLRNAPHLVRPLRFVLPYYASARVPPWKQRLGLLLYDLLAGSAGIRRSRDYPLARLNRDFPGLQRRGLRGGAEFHDAQMDDARLCVTVVRTAALQGAVVANYVEAMAFEKEAGLVRGVRALDRLGGRELRIRARQTLNATGPWGDAMRRLAGDDAGPMLRPTKGVHVVAPPHPFPSPPRGEGHPLPPSRLGGEGLGVRGLAAAFLLLHPADGRVFFVIPWLGKTLIGTTDTVCDDPPDRVGVSPADVDYLLRGHNHYFEQHLSPKDLLNSFVGLRPLVRTRPGEPSALSREFALSASPSGLLTVSGGKYTTYRRMAEVVIDAVVRRLGLRRRCRTRDFPLDGAPREAWEQFEPAAVKRLQSRWALSEEDARHLVRRYGTRADEVAEYLGRDPALRGRVAPGEPDLLAELAYQREQEMAMTRADLLLRRTRLGLFRPELLG